MSVSTCQRKLRQRHLYLRCCNRWLAAETNDAAANDAASAIPDNVLAQLREMGAYGLQVCKNEHEE